MRRLLRSAVMICVLAPGLATLLQAGVVNFDFENPAQFGGSTPGMTPFTYTIGGLTATFSSTSDPGAFVVAPSIFQTLTGNVLFGDGGDLTIAFSSPQSSISLNFASFDTTPLLLTASLGGFGFNGNTSSATGSQPPGTDFPEGSISFSGGPFDSVLLSGPGFSIDNVTVTSSSGQSPTPEPGSLLLCAGAFAALSFVRLRRRSS